MADVLDALIGLCRPIRPVHVARTTQCPLRRAVRLLAAGRVRGATCGACWRMLRWWSAFHPWLLRTGCQNAEESSSMHPRPAGPVVIWGGTSEVAGDERRGQMIAPIPLLSTQSLRHAGDRAT